jgi:hypothetical protein
MALVRRVWFAVLTDGSSHSNLTKVGSQGGHCPPREADRLAPRIPSEVAASHGRHDKWGSVQVQSQHLLQRQGVLVSRMLLLGGRDVN